MKFLAAVVSVLFAFSLNAQRNIFDGFDDNSNNWPVISNDYGVMTVQNGMYHVTGFNDGHWLHTHTVTKGFENHFRIEVSVARDSGTAPDKGVGLTWGVAGDSARMEFLIYGDGHFVFHQVNKGKTQTVSPKDIQFAIDAEGFNNLRVERNMETNMYDFSINEQLVLSSPYVVPANDQVGLYADMSGQFHFDNFWFIEQANSEDSYRPQSLSFGSMCNDDGLYFRSHLGYSFCVPFGWRVDEYKSTHNVVWPVGFPYQVNLDYAKLAIEDSFGVAARNDFKIFVDSAKYAYQRKVTPLERIAVSPGVECWTGQFFYNDVNDKVSYTVNRCYVYCKAKGGFILIETTIPSAEENANMLFQQVALRIAQTVTWE